MAEGEGIRYSDIIKPDDSINKLVNQLEQVNKTYMETAAAIQAGAESISKSLKSVSGATRQGKADIDKSVDAADRLKRAQQELAFALSETGKVVAWLKAQTSDANKMTVEQQRYIQMASGSYDKLNADLKEAVSLYKSLTAAERADSEMGQQVLNIIINLRGKLKELDDQMRPHVQTLTAVQKAEQKLAFLRTEEGVKLMELRKRINELTTSYAQHQKYMQTAEGSYDRLKADLKEAIALYKSLTEAERSDSEMGRQLLSTIVDMQKQIKALDDQMKPHTQTLTEVQKAEQKLAFLQTEEGAKLLELRKRINEIVASHREEKIVVDEVTAAKRKLEQAQSEENITLKQLNLQTLEANRVAKLQAQINTSAEGSYNRLAAQYALNKIELNKMSAAEREATTIGKALEEQTRNIYARMKALQEATGYHALSVGDYGKAWNGLGFSISQVVRELPAAVVSLNTFFLGISNNIPLVVDEIQKLRAQNKLLRAEGKATISVGQTILKSLLGWNTVLIVVLTLLSSFGTEIGRWVASLFKANRAVMSFNKAIKNVRKEMEESNDGFGDKIVILRNLQEQYKNLSTEAEKVKWIENMTDKFNELGLSVNSVTDADNAFINNTDNVINALRLRARATAAQNLAAEKYNEALLKEQEILDIEQTGYAPAAIGATISATTFTGLGPSMYSEDTFDEVVKKKTDEHIASLKREADRLWAEAEQYFDIQHQLLDEADKELGGGNSLTIKFEGRDRDPYEYILRTELAIRKKYEKSQTELIVDEYDKRERAAYATYNANTGELMNTYAKNKRILEDEEDLYRDLTEGERSMLEQTQAAILNTVKSYQDELTKELDDIERDRQIQQLKLVQDTLNKRLALVRKGSQEELAIKLALLRAEEGIEQLENTKLPEDKQIAPEDISAVYSVRAEQTTKETQLQVLKDEQDAVNLALEKVIEGTEEELRLRMWLSRVQEQIALLENEEKPGGQRQDPSAISSIYSKERIRLQGQWLMELYELENQYTVDYYNVRNRTERQQALKEIEAAKALIDVKIDLARQGYIELSDIDKKDLENQRNMLDEQEKLYKGFSGFMRTVGSQGLGGAILDYMGFDEDAIDAFTNATDIILDNLSEIMDAYVEMRQAAVDAAEERVSAAQSAYDAEVEARNNGYANSVATMKAELQAEKRNQQEKERLLKQAQQAQENINSAIQASSLVTATAQLWASYSALPLVGTALAIAAIATMWASFAAAKLKAAQVTRVQSDAYGEGGLEFIDGGSHVSGNDVDLGVKNKRGRRMRVEGGEAVAVINKHRTAKYKKVLPDIINSLNNGIFEEKYTKAFDASSDIAFNISRSSSVDLSKVEDELHTIRRQGEERYVVLPNGYIVIQKGNTKRVIKKS